MAYQASFGRLTDMKCRSLQVGDYDVLDPQVNLCVENAKIVGDLVVDGEALFAGNTSILTPVFLDTIINGDLCVSGTTKTAYLTSGNATITLLAGDVMSTPVEPAGTLLYGLDQNVYFSDGMSWVNITAAAALPQSLQSIAALITHGNEYLYTTGPNTYTTGSITSLMRTLLAQGTINGAQSVLQTVPGVDVQPESALLSSIDAKTPMTPGEMIYATGAATTSVVPSMTFGRSLLNTSSATNARSLMGALGGTILTPNRLVKVSATDNLIETGMSVDGSNNVTGVNNLTINGDLLMSGLLDGITSTERTQLRNINATAISSTQWGYLGAFNQSLTTTSTPTFNGASMGGAKITDLLDPTNDQDAASKAYVDLVGSTGAAPLDAVSFTTVAALPNAPAYASPAETLTSTAGAGVALTVDGITLVVGDNGKRVLVKDQADDRENGVYVVTDYGGGASPWQLTRSTDFNQAAMPLNAGSSVLVLVQEGGSQDGTTWSLKVSIAQVDPLSDSVHFVQIGALPVFSAGSGIDAAALTGGTIQTDISARLKYSGNQLDLNTVATPYGGTGVSMMAGDTNRVLVTDGADGTNAMDISKSAPAGAFVGTSDAQALTNKTITGATNTVRATQLATAGADVVVSAASPPVAGYVLVATTPTTAGWFKPAVVDRVLRVAQSGGDYTSIGAALADIGVGVTAPVVPTPPNGTANSISIVVSPGTYYEVNPLVVPSYVTVQGLGLDNGVFVVPTVASQIVFSMQAASGLLDLTILNNGTNPPGDGSTPLAGITGVQASFGAGDPCVLSKVDVKRCSVCFETVGSGTNETSIMILRECYAVADAAIPAITTLSGYKASNGGSILGFDCIVASKGVGAFTVRGLDVTGMSDTNRGSIAMYNLDCSLCLTALYAGNHAQLALTSATIRLFSQYGLDMYANSNVTLMATTFMDHTSLFPTQIHIRTNGICTLRGVSLVARNDLAQFDANTQISGFSVGLTPGEFQNHFLGEVTVGLPTRGFETALGEGDSHTFGMKVFQYDSVGITYVDISTDLSIENGTSHPIFLNNMAGDMLYIGEDTVNGPDTSFSGVKLVIPSGMGVSPTGGRSNAPTEPPSYHYVWEFFDGIAWRQFPYAVALANPSYASSGRDSFDAGAYQVTFPPLSDPYPILTTTINGQVTIVGLTATKPASGTFWFDSTNVTSWNSWAKTTINGVTGYWIRVRQVSALTTVPELDLVKLHTSRLEVNADGFVEMYGDAKARQEIVKSSEFKEHPTNLLKPSAVDLFASDSLGMELTYRRLASGKNNILTAAFRYPPGIDTADSLDFRWRWAASNNTVANVRWTVRWAYIRNWNSVLGTLAHNNVYTSTGAAPTTAATERSIVFETATNGASGTQVETTCRIDFTDVLPEDTLWVSVERTGTADAYAGDVNILDISVYMMARKLGCHRFEC